MKSLFSCSEENERIRFLALIDSSYLLFPEPPSRERVNSWLAASSSDAVQASEFNRAFAFAQAFARFGAQYRPPAIQAPIFFFQSQGYDGKDMVSTWSKLVPVDSAEVIRVHVLIDTAPSHEGTSMCRALADAVQKAMIGGDSAPIADYNPLVTLQTGRRAAKDLFCVPGAGATVVGFSSLVEALGDSWRVHGLQPQGTHGLRVPHSSVAAGAASYVSSILSLPVNGPLHLLGHSYGGWLVFETAFQLRLAGRAIASVTIIDSNVPDHAPALFRPSSHCAALQQWIEIFELYLDRPLGISVDDLDRLSLDEQLVLIHERLLHWRLMPKTSNPLSLRGPFHAFATALRAHFAPAYALHGRVNLVLAADPKLDPVSNQHLIAGVTEGWRHFAPELRFFYAPGNHMTVLQHPQATVLAKWLTSAMDGADTVSVHRRKP